MGDAPASCVTAGSGVGWTGSMVGCSVGARVGCGSVVTIGASVRRGRCVRLGFLVFFGVGSAVGSEVTVGTVVWVEVGTGAGVPIVIPKLLGSFMKPVAKPANTSAAISRPSATSNGQRRDSLGSGSS